jgi:hypothetical protein
MFACCTCFRKGPAWHISRSVGERAERLLGCEPWDAAEHAVATKNSIKPYRFDLLVPSAMVSDIHFIRAKGEHKSPALNTKKEIWQQTFRGVSEITEAAATKFYRLLGVRVVRKALLK